jgi:predicted ATPase
MRLDELRLAALEDRIEGDLELGRHRELVGELEALAAQHPLRERFRAQLMLALYRSGRQADALELYRQTRHTFVDELGIEPGPTLQELEQAILRQEPSLAAVPPAAQRRALPATVTPLIGRERELEAAQTLLLRDDVRLLSLTGPPGSGKTRLGLAVAHRLESSFPDGVHWVGLAALGDAGLVASAVAGELGVRETAGEPLVEALERSLRGRRLLLVLDNFEHVLRAAPLLAQLLASAPGLKLLVTSRAALRLSGEHEYPVPPLELPDLGRLPKVEALSRNESVALFVTRSAAAAPDFALTPENAPAVAELCVQLDGLPLALELAAARVKLFSPEALVARLADRPALLAGARDMPSRQQTLHDTILWSYELLNPEERTLFARLAVFAGGFTLEAAEVVCGDEGGADVVAGIATLVDNSLVRRRHGRAGEPRFELLRTIRTFALTRLASGAEADEVRRRHAEHYLSLAEAAEPQLRGPEQTQWLERLEIENANFRAALAWCEESRRYDVGARIASALWRFWDTHGHLSEGRRWLEQALTHRGHLPPEIQGELLHGAGALAFNQGDDAAAREWLEEARAIAQRLGDPRRLARSLNNLSAVALWSGEFGRARSLLEDSLPTLRRLGDGWNLALAVENLGNIALYSGDPDRAEPWFEESVALWRDFGDRQCEALSLGALGVVALCRGDHERASRLHRSSLAVFEETGHKEGIAWTLECLAAVAAVADEPERAARLWGAAEAAREAGAD